MTSQNQRSFHSFHLSARSFQKRFRETFGYLRTFGFITPFKVSGRKISVQFGFIMISFCVKTRLNGESGIIKIWVYLTFKKNKYGACTAIFYLVIEYCASVFSGLTIKQFVMCEKCWFFNVLKVILLENTFPFWDCLYDRQRSRTLSNATHAQLTRKCDCTV